jgi:hypothetical protein
MPSEEAPAAEAALEEGRSIAEEEGEEEALTEEDDTLKALSLEIDEKKNFIDLTKQTPKTVAFCLFPDVVCPSIDCVRDHVPNKKQKSSPEVTPHPQAAAAPEGINLKTKHYWYAASQLAVEHFSRVYNLQLDWNRTKKKCISGHFLHEQQFKHGSNVLFFCTTCLKNHKYGLVCVARCAYKGSSETSETTPVLQVVSVFWHDSQCSILLPADRLHPHKHVHIPISFPDIFKDTYSKAVDQLNDFDMPQAFWDDGLTAEDKLQLKKLEGLQHHVVDSISNDTSQEGTGDNVQQPLRPPGMHINAGHKDYDYDDRTYAQLPSPDYAIDPIAHEQAMIRLAFLFCSSLSISNDMAPYLLVLPEVAPMPEEGRAPVINKARTFDFSVNESAHIFMQEIVFLFGGNEIRIVGPDPIHQPCHTDGEDLAHLMSDNKALVDLFKPCSFICPLESERSIYVKNSSTIVSTKKGQGLVFSGDLPHGGITHRDRKWFPALHGHLDSKHHPRSRGCFLPTLNQDTYNPLQHLFLADHEAFFEHFLDQERNLLLLLKEACRRETFIQISRQKEGPSATEGASAPDDAVKKVAEKVHRLLINIAGKRYNFCSAAKRKELAAKSNKQSSNS